MISAAWPVSLCVISIVAVSSGQKQCPAWFNYNETLHECLCHKNFEGFITCSQVENKTYLQLGMAIGYKDEGPLSGTWVASIPYVYPNHVITSFLEIDLGARSAEDSREYLCKKIHRTISNNDIFCGKCNDTHMYGPALYSYGMQCAKCKWSALPKYLALQILPISVLYFAVLIFKIDLTQPIIFHYVIFCSVITTVFRYSTYLSMTYFYSGKPLRVLTKIALTMSGVWSLDFFRFVVPPFCFSKNVSDSTVPFFEFYPAAYLLVVTLLVTVLIKLHSYKMRLILQLWRPVYKLLILCKQNRNPWEALSHTYATFFFLYFGKTIAVALVTAMISSAISQHSTMPVNKLPLYYDPTVTYFDARHVIILMAVFLTATVLIIPAVLLLLVFRTQLFQKFYLTKIGPHWQIKLRVFVHTLENGYKDGSQGTRDYRPMAGGLFLSIILMSCILIAILRSGKHSFNLPWPVACILFAMTAIMYGTLRPYKKRVANNVALIIYGVLVVLSNLLCFISQRSQVTYRTQRQSLLLLTVVVITVVNSAFLGYFSWKGVSYFVTYKRAVKCLRMISQKCGCPCHFNKNEEEQGLLSTPRP